MGVFLFGGDGSGGSGGLWANPAFAQSPPSKPVVAGLVPLGAADDEEVRIELAPYMAELQRLTHKMSLAVGAENPALARFYAYESIESLKRIQNEVPEYDGHPIALLVERFGLPHYRALIDRIDERRSRDEMGRERQRSDGGEDLPATVDEAMSNVVEGCNDCHAATLHEFIRVTDERVRNPFNQDFTR